MDGTPLRSAELLDERPVGVLVHQRIELRWVGQLEPEKPAGAFRVGIDQRRVGFESGVCFHYLPRDRRIDVRGCLHRFHHCDAFAFGHGIPARGQFDEHDGDPVIGLVLRRLDPEMLRRGTTIARDWAERGNPPPLLFSEDEWHASADVFPIEYGDMRDSHVVLHGVDPFERLDVDWEHLRLQCEHELKSKQIQLREQYLLLSSEPAGLGAMLTHSFPTFLTLFRAGLRLAGEVAPREPGAAIDAVAAQAGFDPAPFHEVHRVRTAGGAYEADAESEVVTGYLSAVARTTAWLDRLKRSPDAEQPPA